MPAPWGYTAPDAVKATVDEGLVTAFVGCFCRIVMVLVFFATVGAVAAETEEGGYGFANSAWPPAVATTLV